MKKTKPSVLNMGNGDYFTTNSWKPLFMKIGNHQSGAYDVAL